ncbi:MAG: hypothetical protein LAO08_20575 [Acidobacteriia bacterium]|nr:hypothetical protein [Terriglobia bacterium]
MVPALHAAPGPVTIYYRRVFKGSTPEFIEIKITEPGKATFEIRQLEEDPDAEPFEVGAPVRQKILELAAGLNNFDIASLDIHKKIANLGEKTFRYEHDGEVHQTTFNYTLSAPANQLMQIFEGLARQQSDLTLLVRNVKYDRLGVNDALMQFESDMDHRLLPEPERFLSVLDQIAGDSHFVDIARTRARAIAENIRNSRGH